MVNKNRPVNLDIATFRLPITAYVSILHRVSGVANVFISLALIWLLSQSLASEDSYEYVIELTNLTFVKVVLFLILANLIYHSCAGIRHLIMDMGVGEDSFKSGKISAFAMIAVAMILLTLTFFWLFL